MHELVPVGAEDDTGGRVDLDVLNILCLNPGWSLDPDLYDIIRKHCDHITVKTEVVPDDRLRGCVTCHCIQGLLT